MESFLGMAIDKASEMLGKLEERTTVILDYVKDLKADFIKHEGSLETAHNRIDSTVSQINAMQEPLKQAHSYGTDWMETKKKAVWWGGGVFAAGGAVVGCWKWVAAALGAIIH